MDGAVGFRVCNLRVVVGWAEKRGSGKGDAEDKMHV